MMPGAKYFDKLISERVSDPASMAYMFHKDVPPLSEWTVEKTAASVKLSEIAKKRSLNGKSEKESVARMHERFADHVETIRTMRAKGSTFGQIGRAVGKSEETVRRYFRDFPEKFR